MATTNVSIRMDSDLKAQADALFAELGMNLSTAFNIFVRQSLRDPHRAPEQGDRGRYAGSRAYRGRPEGKEVSGSG